MKPPGEELVSRGVQSTLGLTVAAVVYGVAIGGIFALVYALAQGRVGRLGSARHRGRAGAARVPDRLRGAVPEVPGQPAGLQHRRHDRPAHRAVRGHGGAVGAARRRCRACCGNGCWPRLGGWNATLVAAAGYAVLVGIVMAVLPTIAETPADFPATVLYDFRLASFAGAAGALGRARSDLRCPGRAQRAAGSPIAPRPHAGGGRSSARAARGRCAPDRARALIGIGLPAGPGIAAAHGDGGLGPEAHLPRILGAGSTGARPGRDRDRGRGPAAHRQPHRASPSRWSRRTAVPRTAEPLVAAGQTARWARRPGGGRGRRPAAGRGPAGLGDTAAGR